MRVLEVSQINKYIKELISRDYLLGDLWIKGEISNFKHHSSGHMYFTLKDQTSLLRCVMFRTQCSSLRFLPTDGMKVITRGRISVFERDGQYQLYCEEMQPDGLGALYLAFEQLKAKLEKEGLFSPASKKPLPFFPTRIGVVTSSTGAVIRDIINVSTRRFPNVQIVLFPVSVQGSTASGEISRAIKVLNDKGQVDVIIVARGGGSLEELWAFNEEAVARAIFESAVPVVSAVGHETDYTIADMVADLRAPTPSAAAEIVVPDARELKWKVEAYRRRIFLAVKTRVSAARARLEKVESSLPLRQPFDKVYQLRMMLDINYKYLCKNIQSRVKKLREKLANNASRLNSLSPLSVLSRGYCLAARADSSSVIKSITQVCKNDRIDIKLIDGKAVCKVTHIEEGNINGEYEF